jgi:hypothetical protein
VTPRLVACSQPTYLPWAGLFHRLALVDAFVVMDTVAFTRTGWQNRNRIKGGTGTFWLSVPISANSKRSRRLADVTVVPDGSDAGRGWQWRHWESLRTSYGRAPYWRRYAPALSEVYLDRRWNGLVALNLALLDVLMRMFGIEVEVVRASELGCVGQGSDLVLDQCLRTGASMYVSGINGRDYLVERDFLAAGVSVFYQRYHVTIYPQRFGPFIPNLSVVDLLFNTGPAARDLLLANNVGRADLVRSAPVADGPVVLSDPPQRTVDAP